MPRVWFFFVRSLSMISLFMLRDKCRNKGMKSLNNFLTVWCCQRVCVCLWEVLWSLQDWPSLLPGNWNEAPKWKCLWSCQLCWSWHHLWSMVFTSVKVKPAPGGVACAWVFLFWFGFVVVFFSSFFTWFGLWIGWMGSYGRFFVWDFGDFL